MSRNVDKKTTWWGKYRLAENRSMSWDIGPLRLAVHRLAQEWLVFHETDPVWLDTEETESIDRPPINTEMAAAKGRFVFAETEDILELIPVLADRPVVTKPAIPFHVPAGQQITIYVSTPLWIRINTGEQGIILKEVAIQRPSDTWFGQSTREGELCYAGSTSGRLQLDLLPLRSFRAVTPILISNQSSSSLALEKIKLPVLYLSLFQGSRDCLWTQAVSMTRKPEGGMDVLDIREGPPEHLQNSVLVSGPRHKVDKKILSGTLSMLFG